MSIETIKAIIRREPVMVRAAVTAIVMAIANVVGVSGTELVEFATGLDVDGIILAVIGVIGVATSARRNVTPA